MKEKEIDEILKRIDCNVPLSANFSGYEVVEIVDEIKEDLRIYLQNKTEIMKEKNKENFEKWFRLNFHWTIEDAGDGTYFNALPFEMQIGVYLEYFNSIGYYAQHSFEYKGFNAIMNGDSLGLFDTMNEAYKEAFKKADELINDF